MLYSEGNQVCRKRSGFPPWLLLPCAPVIHKITGRTSDANRTTSRTRGRALSVIYMWGKGYSEGIHLRRLSRLNRAS